MNRPDVSSFSQKIWMWPAAFIGPVATLKNRNNFIFWGFFTIEDTQQKNTESTFHLDYFDFLIDHWLIGRSGEAEVKKPKWNQESVSPAWQLSAVWVSTVWYLQPSRSLGQSWKFMVSPAAWRFCSSSGFSMIQSQVISLVEPVRTEAVRVELSLINPS